MTASKYRTRKLGSMIRSGSARVVGIMRPYPTTADGECYIIETIDHTTEHVRVADRPTWAKRIVEES